jgi:hypothetical protein
VDNFLTREQIDSIVEAMTARDIFAAMPSGQSTEVNGGELAGKAFESAAERQGHGAGALDRVKPGEAVYLARLLGEVFAEGPKDASTETSQGSSDTGDSVPSS